MFQNVIVCSLGFNNAAVFAIFNCLKCKCVNQHMALCYKIIDCFSLSHILVLIYKIITEIADSVLVNLYSFIAKTFRPSTSLKQN